jgi:hypothetical protein
MHLGVEVESNNDVINVLGLVSSLASCIPLIGFYHTIYAGSRKKKCQQEKHVSRALA